MNSWYPLKAVCGWQWPVTERADAAPSEAVFSLLRPTRPSSFLIRPVLVSQNTSPLQGTGLKASFPEPHTFPVTSYWPGSRDLCKKACCILVMLFIHMKHMSVCVAHTLAMYVYGTHHACAYVSCIDLYYKGILSRHLLWKAHSKQALRYFSVMVFWQFKKERYHFEKTNKQTCASLNYIFCCCCFALFCLSLCTFCHDGFKNKGGGL